MTTSSVLLFVSMPVASVEDEETPATVPSSSGRSLVCPVPILPSYTWLPGEFTPCAGSCDDAQHATRDSRSVSVCINANTGRVVPERLCADRLRPKPQIRLCPPLICPSRYLSPTFPPPTTDTSFPFQLSVSFSPGNTVGAWFARSGWLPLTD